VKVKAFSLQRELPQFGDGMLDVVTPQAGRPASTLFPSHEEQLFVS
jgi:hypothetical protein